MKLQIYGKPQKVKLELCKAAVRFYCRQLMSVQLLRNITIRLIFVDKTKLCKDFEAECCWDDDNIKPRVFVVKIDNNLPKKKMLTALSHEMVHVKQFAKQELQYRCREPRCKWRGEPIDDDSIPYRELPWEQEAWGLQDSLYNNFIKQLD